MSFFLYTPTNPYVLARSSNSTNASFSAVTPATSKSADDEGVVRSPPNHVVVLPFGTDANDEAFDCRLIGWRSLSTQGSLYPIHLGTVTATLSSSLTSLSGETPNGTSDLLADTLTASSGSSNLDIVEGVTDQVPAHALVDARGCELVELLFALDTAASANALVAMT